MGTKTPGNSNRVSKTPSIPGLRQVRIILVSVLVPGDVRRETAVFLFVKWTILLS